MFKLFEVACVAVIAAACFALAKIAKTRDLLREYCLIAASAWLCEHTAIAWYNFYHYDPRWSFFIGHVPLLVALIWPLVILFAERVAREVGATESPTPIALALWVCLDASLVEVIAVEAGFWRWTRPGYLHVPVLGILGWGVFTFAFAWAKGRTPVAARSPWRAALTRLALTFVCTHALLLALHWGGLRYIEVELPNESAMVAFAALVAVALMLFRQSSRLSRTTVVPRLLATFLFVCVAVLLPASHAVRWHFAGVALVYFAISIPRPRRNIARGVAP